MPFFGYRFATRLRDLKDRRLHLAPGLAVEPLLAPLVDAACDCGEDPSTLARSA